MKEMIKQDTGKKFRTERESVILRVSTVTLLGNMILSILKVLAGLVGRSSAMISDGIHSASDVFSTIIVLVGVHFAEKEEDERHPYGHERFECVAAIVLAVVLLLTGVGIGYDGILRLIDAWHGELTIAVPGILALSAAVFSTIIKEAMFWYTRAAARNISSDALMADAWHHRSDALSSIGAFVGILGARHGYPFLDPLASLIICIFILKASAEIFFDAVRKMTDECGDRQVEEQMREMIRQVKGVCRIDLLKTRVFGSRLYVEAEIAVDGSLSLTEAHEIAEEVHREIEQEFPAVKHCMVHVNPV